MRKTIIAVICFLSVQSVFAQTDRARMERERQEIQKELQEIQSEYNKVKGQKKATIGQLTVLQRKMEVQDRYIGNINREIHSITDDIYLSNLEINRLQGQLDTLKAQYARSVVYAYKNKSSYDFLNFIFSASSFNDALKRIAYLKSYRTYRQQQVNSIVETQRLIKDRKQQLIGKQTQKKSALQNQQQQLEVLSDQKREKDEVVAKLKSQEKDLSRQIAAQKKRFREVTNQIAAVVRREMLAARRKADEDAAARRRSDAASNSSNNTGSVTTNTNKPSASKPRYDVLNLNASDVALNNSFEKNRGSLPWPVDNGYVSIPFGKSKVGNLETDNPGITLSTPSAGTPVKAVFDGQVSAVSNIGDGMVVMIRHGKYFSVYSNLSSANVSKGMEVKRGEVIGRTSQADDGTGGQMDFILMMESHNVNPSSWLRRH